ncbi:MAG TPA: cytochrome P450 [Hyphomicrobiaceae bacterium]|nr:cytochrome P450 [Hyphomicrobiaceae bacterium]
MVTRPPVTDWTTDWDHLDPQWVDDPYPIWSALRQRCPIAHTDRYNGVYLPTRYADVRAIAYDTEHFSSRKVAVREKHPPTDRGAPPITSDPPRHRLARMVLLPPFTPDATERLKPRARAICNELIDAFIGNGACDAAVDYAQHIPTRVMAHMLGVPESDGETFRKWINAVLQEGAVDQPGLVRAVEEMTEYFRGPMQERRHRPGNDLISYLVQQTYEDGRALTDNHVLGSVRLLLVAGIDTTWSAIGAFIWHLARTPEDRRRLVAEPALMPTAIEELLRAYAPVTMAREVVAETEIGGCPMRPGQMVLLSFPAANRDPAMFADADKVVIDRKENRHAAFGLGIHRCIGSNLARMELTVALEELLQRVPEFELNGPVTWSEGTVRGPRRLPIRFG